MDMNIARKMISYYIIEFPKDTNLSGEASSL